MRPRLVAVLALLVAACAHAPAPPVETAVHGAHPTGPARPVALPHYLVDGTSGKLLGDDELDARIRAVRAVYVGETHTDPHHHAVELALFERLVSLDADVALGLEMLPRSMQPQLEAFVGGATTEAQFLVAVDWHKTWGFDWGWYQPLLALCHEKHLRAYALNARHGLAHDVAQKGLAGLPADERAELPEIVPGPEAHRAFVHEALGEHIGNDAAKFERYYAAQLVWDETMADSVARALTADGAPHRMLVVAGSGHVRRFSVPERAARRGAGAFLTVLPVTQAELDDALQEHRADVLWVLIHP